MELYIYILLVIIGLISILTENNKLVSLIYIPFIFIFILTVRLSGYDIDIQHYADAMLITDDNSIYYLKEFVFWYSQRFLYIILNNDLLVFLFTDIIWIILVLKVSNTLNEGVKFKNGLIIILMTSFPFFFGYENVYRQFYGTIMVLLSYSLINKKLKISIFIFLISLLIHNTMFLLLPFLIMKKKFNMKYKIFIVTFILIIFIILLNYMSQFKSGHTTGIDMSTYYMLLMVIASCIYIIKFNFNINLIYKLMPSLYSSLILIVPLQFMSFDMIAERLGMVFVIFLLYDLYSYSNTVLNKEYRIFFRTMLLLVFTLPVLFFSSSMMFFN